MKTLEFNLSVDEANLILEALGQLPFARVYALIANLQEQARRQLGQNGAPVAEDARSAGPSLQHASTGDHGT